MLACVDPRIVALVEVLAALGIAGFWIQWFRSEHDAPWLPTGYVLHERCFVYPDSLLAALLVVSAILLVGGEPLGERLALVCGGMLLFLTVIDAAYFAQNGMFAGERNGARNLALTLLLGALSLFLILRFL